MTSTSCTCEHPGWCDRHKCTKTANWHKLCQTRADYFALWEEGRGPGQKGPTRQQPRKKPVPGPGTELRKILGCGYGCAFAKQMNEWGPDVCLERIDEIIERVRAQGDEFETPMSVEAARRTVMLAIERARQNATAID